MFLHVLTDVMFIHGIVQCGHGLKSGVSLLRVSHSSVLVRWLGLPEGTSLNC